MGVEPPFIYDKPSSYTFAGPTHRGFDPKAATRASWSPPAPKPKREGPLIDFNRHPDSYLIVPYGNLNVEPMNPKTKIRVQRSRKAQLFFRFLAFIGGLGLLFCVIAINKTSTSVGWIIRAGPAVALAHSVYAIYHLCRDAAGRSAASSASYMLFAALVDTGLIPCFAFSAVMANTDLQTNAYGWGTLFGDDEISRKIIKAFFLTCLTEGGLMAVSLIIDVYLATVFRKIAKMPPDMNPLEDNLTARPNGKHKRNKSELRFEKHLSDSTLATQRMSQAMDASPSNFKRVPFIHTRTDSADSVTLYGNERALNSRVSLRNVMIDATTDPYRNSGRESLQPSRPGSVITPAANARAPGAGLSNKPVRSFGLAREDDRSRASWLSYTDYEGVPTALSESAHQQLDSHVRPLSPVSMLSERDFAVDRTQAERQNWFSNSVSTTPQKGQAHVPFMHDNVSSDSLERVSSPDRVAPRACQQQKKRSRDPLGMNPPTPIQDRFHHREESQHPQAQALSTPQRSVLHDIQVNSASRPGMGSRPSSFVGSGGKSRYYGDLRSSIGGSPTRESFDSPTKQQYQRDHSDDYMRTHTMSSEDSGNFQVYDSEDDDEVPPRERPRDEEHFRGLYDAVCKVDAIRHTAFGGTDSWDDSRKVSNSTGYDLKSGYAGLGSEFGLGMARRRDVSGKVAEEGRGGDGYGGLGVSEEKDGAVLTGQGVRGGAAGWAKFHGR